MAKGFIMSGRIKATEPESTKTCTSRYTDFQVLPVNIYTYIYNLNLSVVKFHCLIFKKLNNCL